MIPDLMLIDQAWSHQGSVPHTTLKPLVEQVIAALDAGLVSISSFDSTTNTWTVNQSLKKAILLYFRLQDCDLMDDGQAYDKIPLKFHKWTAHTFQEAGLRVIPGAVVRYGAYLAPRVIVMPSFVNIGAHVGEETLIDSYATVGSCAQIGKRCHLSAGVLIGGVLEPLQANPVIIEDDCFIGAQSSVVEGVRVGQGSVLAMGVHVGASTPILDAQTQTVTYGQIPPYCVVIPGMITKQSQGFGQACALIKKRVDAQTRAKTSPNDLLREGLQGSHAA